LAIRILFAGLPTGFWCCAKEKYGAIKATINEKVWLLILLMVSRILPCPRFLGRRLKVEIFFRDPNLDPEN
jgi:hypothetical protein